MKFSIKDFLSKCDQIRSFLRIWSHLLKKYLTENFIFCAVDTLTNTLKSCSALQSCAFVDHLNIQSELWHQITIKYNFDLHAKFQKENQW